LADIPVIVVTAFAARGGLPAGCRVLHKPFDREVLLAEARALTRVPAEPITPAGSIRGARAARRA
jgi:DNA-binding response OmpR family regulator